MITIRPSEERLRTETGWLDSRHSFSFGEHYDPDWMGFRSLRVINEDWIAGGAGFGMHPHRDMEIVTVVLEGALNHEDSLGNGSAILPGEVQRMSAGSGIFHSEYNASGAEPAHILQIWIHPERSGLAPGYEQRDFAADGRTGPLRLLASRDGREGSITMHQDAALYSAALEADQEVRHPLGPDRHAWVHVVRGTVSVNGRTLGAGDGAALSEEQAVNLRAEAPAEVLLFDLA